MRPTTKDLARAAGVSLATVDRVLNGRSGVREETVAAVNEAIERIGFVRNLSAANLARRRIYRLAFLLPITGDAFLTTLESHIAEAATAFASEGIQVEMRRAIGSDPHQIAKTLAELSADDLDGVAVLAPESPQVRDAMARLRGRGVQVVRFLSGQSGEAGGDSVGIDNRAAGATAGRLMGRFCSGRPGQILVIADTMNARDSVERRQGFDQVITGNFPELAALPSLETHGDAERTRTILRNAYANHPDIVGVYVLASEARLPLEAIDATSDSTGQVIIAHERTGFTERLLLEGKLAAVIAQNPGHLARSAIRVMRARCDGRQPIASQEEIRIEILLPDNLRPHLPADAPATARP
ncbi:LacI family DNA-binding transcriptional regulator [Paracoccus sp. MBLB3053]|uniref:LacI family DNA-binding transcriptional regulator n=1 Tax=Paracoccus aurantius TaxID=3073814 RepID=A0ABU2HY89_9RHOB|nr:LacI family DNA-binding transcriptional regulator [Paracoccus sp. MBLB3053]MDS9470021.1 LacI family DNA-binding transcriptional regulator [Paracoccus sp. MBLB3053]